MSEIVKLAKTGNYQVACQRHFDVVHPNWRAYNIKTADGAANHPNLWFQASTEYHKALRGPQPSTSIQQGSTETAGAVPGATTDHQDDYEAEMAMDHA